MYSVFANKLVYIYIYIYIYIYTLSNNFIYYIYLTLLHFFSINFLYDCKLLFPLLCSSDYSNTMKTENLS